jgi:primosomal protein N' (replication factor Y)
MHYTPFTALANVVVRSRIEEQALSRSAALGRRLQPPPDGLKVLGPAVAAMARLKNEFRYQMLLKAASRKVLKQALEELRSLAAAEKWNPASLVIDVDPVTLI